MMPAYSKKFVLSTQVSMLARAAVTAGRSLWPAFSRCPLGQESWSCAILSEGRAVGIFRFWLEASDTVRFSLQMPDEGWKKEDLYRLLLQMNAMMIRTCHPHRIYCTPANRMIREILSNQLYYQKGRKWQRLVEPWRYRVEDNVFDEEGFIIHQGKMEELGFGLFNTKERGCGWIGAYNLFRLYGHEITMQEASKALSMYDPTGKVFGQDVYTLYFWLKRRGLPVHLTVFSRRAVVEAMKKSQYGILLYIHRHGSHYTAYEKVGENSFHFFNAVYGRTRMVMSAEEFLAQHAVMPMNMLIHID